MIDALDGIPVLEDLFAGPPFGTGIFTAALILAVMVIPFIAATMRDVFETVPAVYKESAYGVGCTTWEVMRSIVLPYTRVSVVGGIMLGLGRALGETMAVTFVIGNTDRIATSLFGPGNTIASIVALEFPESPAGSLKLSSLLALGFILFVISFIVLAISRLLLRPRLKAVAHERNCRRRPGPATTSVATALGSPPSSRQPDRQGAVHRGDGDRAAAPCLDPGDAGLARRRRAVARGVHQAPRGRRDRTAACSTRSSAR